MRYLVTDDQVIHFKKEGLIELVGLKVDLLVPKSTHSHFNLIQRDPHLKEQIKKAHLEKIAMQMTKKRQLSLIYDCLLPKGLYSLKKNASATRLECAFLICLETQQLFLVGWHHEMLIESSYFLIAYGTPPCRYKKNPEDPYQNALKEFGFGYGDAIQY
jgi:hypothetical protein